MLKSKQFTDEEWLALPEVERQAHLRLDREFEAYRQRQDAQARAKGFANREEEHAWMFQQREKKLTEYCASRGITREQHMKEMKAKAARRRQKYDRGPNPVKDFAHCKCKGMSPAQSSMPKLTTYGQSTSYLRFARRL